ncbi:hypothetical protein GobsT_64140 [Gemmata obscuriglobus]|uniref:hypothetical protein n=1 Tax=Gemmata obscuriglobus TaxID=114 RepID=UPI00016C4ED1|nr:hypothetical protein [Gemmata obscuriglobus]QEG31592.1 hypothetical protein GobsT_64140 [Gemmata obscuriglobus]VTS10934.1 unnamed protein product [Gemmata obscuriglobus UQM 2246]
MTLILRIVEPATPVDLGAAGVCRVGLAELVGAWGRGPVRHVVYLGDWNVGAAA